MNNRVPESQALTHTPPHEPVPGAGAKKPPTQVAGVQGFSAFEAKPTEPLLIDWQHLFSLPPFQMYAVERAGKSADNVMSWMPDWLRSHEGTHQALYDDYCQWHRDKGCWPNESPLGQLIAADSDTLTA